MILPNKQLNIKLCYQNILKIKEKGGQRTKKKSLFSLQKKNTPTRVIGLELGRPEKGVRAKAKILKVTLKPTNQSPYNRKKKKQ